MGGLPPAKYMRIERADRVGGFIFEYIVCHPYRQRVGESVKFNARQWYQQRRKAGFARPVITSGCIDTNSSCALAQGIIFLIIQRRRETSSRTNGAYNFTGGNIREKNCSFFCYPSPFILFPFLLSSRCVSAVTAVRCNSLPASKQVINNRNAGRI